MNYKGFNIKTKKMNELDCKINVNKFKGLYKSVYKYYNEILK